jgi:hypothetical protein
VGKAGLNGTAVKGGHEAEEPATAAEEHGEDAE